MASRTVAQGSSKELRRVGYVLKLFVEHGKKFAPFDILLPTVCLMLYQVTEPTKLLPRKQNTVSVF